MKWYNVVSQKANGLFRITFITTFPNAEKDSIWHKKKTFWWYRSMGNQQLWEVDLNITIHCDMNIIKYLDQTWEIQHVDPFEKQQSNKLHQ